MKKRIVRFLLGIVIILIVLVSVCLFLIDSLAKSGVEKGTAYALDVETRLDDMDLSLLRGHVMMDGLNIANPQGFTSNHLMRSGRFDLEVQPASLLSDTVEVKRFELDGLDINIEQQLKGSNISKIFSNLKRFAGDKEKVPQTDEDDREGSGKKIKLDRIVIRNVVAHFHLLAELAPSGPLTVRVPEISLENVSSADSPALRVSELVAKLLPAVLKSVIEQGEGTIPSEFLSDLDGQLVSVAGVLGDRFGALTGEAAEGAKRALEESKKALDETGKAVEKLLGGKKD